ncbi:hypothetical protein [Sorangium sp. So ce381]|uniref:hypothetical protein n=1 Tax=Sorangium sp. So ce381 TaxID=3133307 RepID=UPI003F5C176E
MNLRPGARPLAVFFLGSILASAACGGPPTPSPIEGEPICPDFEVGASRAHMRGSLRFPVTLTVREGKEPITRTTLTGRRSKDDPPSRILLSDQDAEYEIEWAQCENERAPRTHVVGREAKHQAEYACGHATVYKTDKLVTRKGDAASRTVHFAAPPKVECWESELPPTPPPPAPPAVPEETPPDAGTDADADAGAAPVDAGATPADAGTKATDAGAPRDGGAGGVAKPRRAGAADAGTTPPGP